MKTSRSLSLRARMLILLIAVTTIFLVIMGAVTTTVVASRLASSFDGEFRLALAHDPRQLAENPGDYTVAVAAPRTGDVVTLTQGRLSQQLQQALSQLSPAQYPADFAHQPFTLSAGGEQFQAEMRRVMPGAVAASGVSPPPSRLLVLVVARPASVEASQVSALIITELITGGALLALLGICGGWLIGRGLEPLDEMASTAKEITARGDLTTRVAGADERTEVGRLGSAINTMLERIQQAFGARLRSEQKVREFAADASHELRTPLTTIRGYAELYRQGALGPDELPNAMRRIEQEAQRMSTMVAELLELARLDRTSSLDLAETDLAGVVRDAVADAVAVEPERPVRAEAPPRLVAMVDEARIRQVLANLLGNVRAHTPVTTPVAVRLGALTGGVLLEVADAGPGMSAEDTAKAFDRFHRATESANGGGHGSGGGSGLGLSIVQAIARAHGGQATLESWPGRGTRVRIWLPTRAAP
jgi:signal transduction histidine kinase